MRSCDAIQIAELMTQPLVLGIELDDSRHTLPQHLERDPFNDDSLLAVGLPLPGLDLHSKYWRHYLRTQIKGKLKTAQVSRQSPQTAKVAFKSKPAQQCVQADLVVGPAFWIGSSERIFPLRELVLPPSR